MIGSVGANSFHSIPNRVEPVMDESNSSPLSEGRGSVEYVGRRLHKGRRN